MRGFFRQGSVVLSVFECTGSACSWEVFLQWQRERVGVNICKWFDLKHRHECYILLTFCCGQQSGAADQKHDGCDGELHHPESVLSRGMPVKCEVSVCCSRAQVCTLPFKERDSSHDTRVCCAITTNLLFQGTLSFSLSSLNGHYYIAFSFTSKYKNTS